jgi:hypothetical protein
MAGSRRKMQGCVAILIHGGQIWLPGRQQPPQQLHVAILGSPVLSQLPLLRAMHRNAFLYTKEPTSHRLRRIILVLCKVLKCSYPERAMRCICRKAQRL